jgi:Tat protein translocase TatB subunit
MGIGFLELVVIGVFALILFGPSKLPEMMKLAAKYYVQFRRSSNEFKGAFDLMLRDAENTLRSEEMAHLKSLMKTEVAHLNQIVDSNHHPQNDTAHALNQTQDVGRLILEQKSEPVDTANHKYDHSDAPAPNHTPTHSEATDHHSNRPIAPFDWHESTTTKQVDLPTISAETTINKIS